MKKSFARYVAKAFERDATHEQLTQGRSCDTHSDIGPFKDDLQRTFENELRRLNRTEAKALKKRAKQHALLQPIPVIQGWAQGSQALVSISRLPVAGIWSLRCLQMASRKLPMGFLRPRALCARPSEPFEPVAQTRSGLAAGRTESCRRESPDPPSVRQLMRRR